MKFECPPPPPWCGCGVVVSATSPGGGVCWEAIAECACIIAQSVRHVHRFTCTVHVFNRFQEDHALMCHLLLLLKLCETYSQSFVVVALQQGVWDVANSVPVPGMQVCVCAHARPCAPASYRKALSLRWSWFL